MSTPDDIKHFLVACNPKIQTTTVQEFGTDYDAAQDAYQKAGRRAFGTDLDIVLLRADSIETIKCTHASYFGATIAG
jgi:hypothetical protein